MSFRNNQNIKNIQAKLKLHLDELEDNLEYDKAYWENLQLDKVSVTSVIEEHHLEIVHHINEIKHHLDKITHHKKRLDYIDRNLSLHSKIEDADNESRCNQGDTVKRSVEDKLNFKIRRVSKTSSMKYVLQWENILEERKGENVFNAIPFRNKNKTSELEYSMPQTMVKNRIEKFEGFYQPKRTSSTIETFLDFSGEKPRRIKSYPIIEDCEGEREEVIQNSESVSCLNSAIPKQSGDVCESVVCESTCVAIKQSDESILIMKDVETDEAEDEDISKPRIIQMHFKQQPLRSEEN